jgi:DEAD/DEAH box helicase domain-containing protein
MNIVIFDCEIRALIPDHDKPRNPDLNYCQGWHDFEGMGISVVTAYDIKEARPHVFMADNLLDFAKLVADRDLCVTFNGAMFDLPLLDAHGIVTPSQKHFDLASAIWAAAGVPAGEHPKGLGLDALCWANNIPGKTGNGADAPRLWQSGHHGRLIDYGLGDTLATLRLYRLIASCNGCVDPRSVDGGNAYGRWLTVRVPQ